MANAPVRLRRPMAANRRFQLSWRKSCCRSSRLTGACAATRSRIAVSNALVSVITASMKTRVHTGTLIPGRQSEESLTMRQGAGTCSSIELLRGELRETECKEVVVEPFAVHQFAVGTCFHKAAFVQNEDAIGPLDRRLVLPHHLAMHYITLFKQRCTIHHQVRLSNQFLGIPFRNIFPHRHDLQPRIQFL